MPDITAATLGAGFLQSRSAKSAANTQADAQIRAQELALEQSMPWSTSGLFGSAKFDQDTREAKLGLDSDWQTEYDLALAGAKKQRGYIAGMEADPMAAGKKFYDMQKALYAPEQEKDRLELEKRLIAQGMFGSTGGGIQVEALRKAQEMQDLEAQYAGLDKAQEMIDTYTSRATDELGTAESIGLLPLKYANLGRGLGQDMGSIAKSGAEMRSAAAATRAMGQVGSTRALTGAFKDLYAPKQPYAQYTPPGWHDITNPTPTFNINDLSGVR